MERIAGCIADPGKLLEPMQRMGPARVHRSFCGICLVLALARSAPGAQVQEPGILKVHESRAGNRHSRDFRVTVRSGDFFHIQAIKQGIDLILSIQDPLGREVVSSKSTNSVVGIEHASAIAELAGEYTVRVTAKGAAVPGGRYRIELLALRSPTPDDRLRLRAETLFRTAMQEEPAGDDAAHLRTIGKYAEAAELFDRLGEPGLKALALNRIGIVYDTLGERQKALESYNLALTIRHSLHDRAGEGATLNNIAIMYAEMGEKPKALDLFNRALLIRRAAGDRPGMAATLINMAALYSRSGEKLTAIRVYSKALPIYQALADRAGQARTLESIAAMYYDTGDVQTGLSFSTRALPIRRALGDRPGEAATLYNIGVIYNDHGEKRKALEPFNQALDIYRGAGDRTSEAQTLNQMGVVYSDLGEKPKALELYRQALPIFHAIGDQTGEAGALNNIGALYSDLADQQKALEFYNQAAAIYGVAGDRAGEAATLDNIGNVYSLLGQKQQALDFFTRAAAMRPAGADRNAEANNLNSAGTVYRDLGEPQKALEHFQQALAIGRALGDRQGEAASLANIGIVYSDLGERQKALEFFSQALPLKRAAGDRTGEANTLNGMASVYSALGENQKALDFFNQALPIYRSMGNRTGEAAILVNIGSVYSTLGDAQRALDFCDRALTIDRAIGDQASEAYGLVNLGSVYLSLGRHQKALEFYNEALSLFRSTAGLGGEASALDDLGRVYSALGDKQEALEFYRQSLTLRQDMGDRTGVAGTLNNIGNAYAALGDRKRALEFYNQALPIFRAVGYRDGEADTLNDMAVAYDDLGEREKALEFYNQALPIFRAVGDLSGEAGTLNNIGSVYDLLGQKQHAVELYSQALVTLRTVGNRRDEAATLDNLRAVFRESQPDLAILFGKQAINVLQTVRRDNRGMEGSLRRTYEKSIESYYRNLADLLVQRQRFAEAEEILGLLKEKETSDFIKRDSVADQLRSATLMDAEKAALARYDQVVGQVVTLGQQKAALLAKEARDPLSDAERAQSDRLDRDLGAANMVLQRFFQEQEKSFTASSAAAARLNVLREAEGLQDTLSALGPDVVAIYTLVLPEKYVAMLVTAGARKAYTSFIKEGDLNTKVFEFRRLLQNPASNPLPLAQELYGIVFPEGLRQDLESMHARTIMWSIDSTLRYIPIAALHDGQDYLVNRFRNSLITPASMARLTDTPKAQWQGVGFGVSEALSGFPALPGVPAELGDIFQQQNGRAAPVPGGVRLNADFTRDAFLNDLRQPNKSVVHIATHFDSRPGEADQSHLLLGDGSTWNLKDIESMTRLFNGVDLLTLSACNTAFTNNSEDGREVDSFGTIAQRLGAKGVIASLWSVSDEGTARLMQTMYRLRQQDPAMGKNEALRQAQNQMASGTLRSGATGAIDRGVSVPGAPAANRERDWRHPYYWAPFILIGNWK